MGECWYYLEMLGAEEFKNKNELANPNPASVDHKVILKFRTTKHTWQLFLIKVSRLWRPRVRAETPFKAMERNTGAHVSGFCGSHKNGVSPSSS